MANAAYGQQITRIETGVVVAHTEDVCPNRSYAKIVLKLSEGHELDDTWTSTLDELERNIRALFSSRIHTAYYNFSGLLLRRIVAVRHRVLKFTVHETKRKKRGRFNFIGEIGSTLFGSPSPSDIKSPKEANEN